MKYSCTINAWAFVAMSVIFGCSTELKPANVKVEDVRRHYYPVMVGEILTLSYEIENIGDEPLVISEIQTTCGCISKDAGRKIIPRGQKTILNFEYDSSKNLGYVEHEIRLYGNFDTTNVLKLYFDVNVVPDADYTKDYEALHKESFRERVRDKKGDRETNRKSYYVDSVFKAPQ